MIPDRVLVVAEAAQGYEGDPSLAKLLARAAGVAGADLVKFQIVYADELASRSYQHYALFRQLEMDDAAWRAAADEARKAGAGLAFDVYGERSLSLALELRADAVKIHATDFFNHPLVTRALDEAPHVFLSAGGIEIEEVQAFFARHPRATTRSTLFYGYQAEPTPTEDNHLARLASLRTLFPGLALGFMDHTDGAGDDAGWLATLALPFGVTAIEKHLSLDRELGLEDHVSALAPAAFRSFVRRVRTAEAALGQAGLDLTPAERAYRRRAVKVVVAARALEACQTLSDADLTLLRTALADGDQPFNRVEDVSGRAVIRAIGAGEAICAGDLK